MIERLKALRSALNLSQAAFAESIGLKQSTIGDIERGTNRLTERNIAAICRVFNVNPDWLRSGVGDMFIPPKESDVVSQITAENQLDEIEIAMLKSYLELPHEWRQMVCEYGRNFLRNMQQQNSKTSVGLSKPESKLSVSEKRRIVEQELDAEEKGLTSLASIGTNGLKKNKKVLFKPN